MKKTVFIFAAMMFAAVFCSPAAFGQTDETKKPSVADLGWFTGCWELNVPEREMTITEMWMKPAGGTLVGVGRTVVKGRTVSYEYLRVAETTDGGIDYIAKPSSNPGETAFRLKPTDGKELVFENTAHDFPQRIIYRKGEADALFARIEGKRNGETRGMDIPMKRVACQ